MQPKEQITKVRASRRFKPEWIKDLPWLCLSTYGFMYCSLCVERGVVNSMSRRHGKDGIGTADFKVTTVRDHAKQHHGEDLHGPKEAPLVRSFTNQLNGHDNHLKMLMKNVYFLAKKRSPMAHLVDLCHLGILQGLPLHISYRNAHTAADMLVSLAAAIRATWVPHARQSASLGLGTDESTSIDMEGKLILYLRYLHRGLPRTRFWKIMSVDDKSAAGIFENLEQAFEEDDMPCRSVASLATDGANVMLGCNSGIAARMKSSWNAFLLVTHCIAHRGALCASGAAKDHALSEWFERCLRDVIFYFSNSTNRSTALANLQEHLQLDALKMLKLHAVRWLSRDACTARLLKNYQALVIEFQNDAKAHRPTTAASTSAGGIWAFMVTHLFVFCLCAYADILAKLALISRLFQQQVVTYSVVTQGVRDLLTYLRFTYLDSQNMGGLHLRDLLQPIAHSLSAEKIEKIKTYQFRNTTINFSASEHEAAKKGIRGYVDGLIQEFKDRFPDDQLMAALEIFDPRLLPQKVSEWKLRGTSYGAASIEKLCAEFGKAHVTTPITRNRSASITHEAMVRSAIVRHEWELLRNQLFEAWMTHLRDAAPLATPDERERAIDAFIDAFYQPILQGDRYKEIAILVAIWRVEFLSSVDCERGFSVMALVMTKLSNRMSTTVLDARMQIAIEGPPLDDEEGLLSAILDDALVRWKDMCRRNVRKSHPGKAGRHPKPKLDVRVQARGSLARQQEDENAATPTAIKLLQEDEIDDDDEEPNVPSSEGDVGADRTDLPSHEELLAGVAPFQPPEGWLVEPAPKPEDWKPNMYPWVGKRIAHKFDSGWSCLGTYKECYNGYDKRYRGMHKVKYVDGYDGYHPLSASTYGMAGHWVILKAVSSGLGETSAMPNIAKSSSSHVRSSSVHVGASASTATAQKMHSFFQRPHERKNTNASESATSEGKKTAALSDPQPAAASEPSTFPQTQGQARSETTAERHQRRVARKAEILIPKAYLLVIFDVEHTGAFKGESLKDAEIWQLGSTILLCTEGRTTPIHGIPTGINSLVHSTRKMAVGKDKDGNRVGALAIAEQAGVTSVMLRLAPKIEDVACMWLATINAARSSLNHLLHLPVVLGGHHAHSVDFNCFMHNMERIKGQGTEWLQAAGVIGVLDTLKLAKQLPLKVLGLLPRTEKRGAPSAKNEYLYLALVPEAERKAMHWHDAYDDACATAAWLGSESAQSVLDSYAAGNTNEAYWSIEKALNVLGLNLGHTSTDR